MKFTTLHSLRSLVAPKAAALITAAMATLATPANSEDAVPENLGDIIDLAIEIEKAPSKPTEKPNKAAEETKKAKTDQKKDPKARLYLANGDTLSGLPESVTANKQLLFQSESLRQTASFPLDNVLSINLNNWKQPSNAKTVARVQLHPRFRESSGDTMFGELKELTPDSIKLNTWYGGIITLKRAMVQSLKIISNTPGNYYGPNSIHEWSIAGDKDSWKLRNGALVSEALGNIGRDVGLRAMSHISFDASWKNSMRFKLQLYSSDVTKNNPAAYYEININRSYAYMRTRGKNNGGRARAFAGGRWKQIAVRPEENYAHFDVFVDRKTGAITVYINGQRACMLQSQNPDPKNLGTGLAFVSENRYPVEISNIAVTPWNGKTFPKPKANPKAKAAAQGEVKKPTTEGDKPTKEEDKAPHRIILNNGDEVPGTVGKVEEDRMLIATKYTDIRIPINRIKSLSLGDSGEEPKKYREDIRAWFHTGGHVTIKLNSFKDGKITGFSQALGDVSFDLAAFARIDFHIYDNKANEARKKIRY